MRLRNLFCHYATWESMDRAAYFANKKCTPRTFVVKEQIYLLISSRIRFAIKPPKISQRYYGPWKIIKNIRNVAYKLVLAKASILCSMLID